jgi:hypothetical protein
VKDPDEVPPQFSYLLVVSSRFSLVHDGRNVIRRARVPRATAPTLSVWQKHNSVRRQINRDRSCRHRESAMPAKCCHSRFSSAWSAGAPTWQLTRGPAAARPARNGRAPGTAAGGRDGANRRSGGATQLQQPQKRGDLPVTGGPLWRGLLLSKTTT